MDWKNLPEKIKEQIPEKYRDRVATGVEALLGIIPYTSGTLATVFGNYMNDVKLNKIASAVDELAKKINVADIVLDKLLTESQVCELLEKHLTEIGVTSDETKCELLTNSLKNAFTDPNLKFGDKELFLATLKELTSHEVLLLRELYFGRDPFIERIYPQRRQEELPGIGLETSTLNKIAGGYYVNQPSYSVESSTYKKGGSTLEGYFKGIFKEKWDLFKGVCYKLDAKGLTNFKENFDNNVYIEEKLKDDYEKFNWLNPTTNIYVGNSVTSASVFGTHIPVYGAEARTGYQGSKTEFGEKFIKYVTS